MIHNRSKIGFPIIFPNISYSKKGRHFQFQTSCDSY